MDSKGAKMINGVYDHFLRGIKEPQVNGWTLVDISSTAGAWKNDKSKTYAYAYRGMITPEDIRVVPTLVSNKVATTARYKKDAAFTRKNQPPQGYCRIAFGHSLGGAIVDQILADGLASSATSYNPAIELSKLNNSGNKRLYNRHDFLYKLIGLHASNVHTINNDAFSKISAGLNFFNIAKSYYEHNLSQFIDKEKEKIKRPKTVGEDERAAVSPGQVRESNQVRESEEPSKQRSYIIQSVVLDKEAFPTLDKAKTWAAQHNYKTSKHDETTNSWRFRQVSPEIFKTNQYEAKTIPLKDTGNLIVAYKV